jgi:hypothetical protein
MKTNLKALKNKIEGDVLPTREHRSVVLSEQALRHVNGAMPPAGGTNSCSPCEDDSLD